MANAHEDQPSTALATVERPPTDVVEWGEWDPEKVRADLARIQQFMAAHMREGVDYGQPFPGSQGTPTLLKPGAEKLAALFHLVIDEEVLTRTENWEGLGFFHYEIKCLLTRQDTGALIATGTGSCNSKEAKYRYRNGGPACPACGKELRLSRDRPEFYCWARQGGCGAVYPRAEHPDWDLGKVETEVFDQVNTIRKMASKRALIDATLKATRASSFFTQDLEDIPGGQQERGRDDDRDRGERDEYGARPMQPRQDGGEKHNGVLMPSRMANVGDLLQAARYHDVSVEDVCSILNVQAVASIAPQVQHEYDGDYGRAWAVVAHTKGIQDAAGADSGDLATGAPAGATEAPAEFHEVEE